MKRKGKEITAPTSVRIEPKVRSKVIKVYGSVQKFVDIMLTAAGLANYDDHIKKNIYNR